MNDPHWEAIDRELAELGACKVTTGDPAARERVSQWSLLVLLTLLAVAFALGRWTPRGASEFEHVSRKHYACNLRAAA
jgi:hypothetical protein